MGWWYGANREWTQNRVTPEGGLWSGGRRTGRQDRRHNMAGREIACVCRKEEIREREKSREKRVRINFLGGRDKKGIFVFVRRQKAIDRPRMRRRFKFSAVQLFPMDTVSGTSHRKK